MKYIQLTRRLFSKDISHPHPQLELVRPCPYAKVVSRSENVVIFAGELLYIYFTPRPSVPDVLRPSQNFLPYIIRATLRSLSTHLVRPSVPPSQDHVAQDVRVQACKDS